MAFAEVKDRLTRPDQMRFDYAHHVADEVSVTDTLLPPEPQDITVFPTGLEQKIILFNALQNTRPDLFQDPLFQDSLNPLAYTGKWLTPEGNTKLYGEPALHGMSKGKLLELYTTATMARSLVDWKINHTAVDRGVSFTIDDDGMELGELAFMSALNQYDAFVPYYRWGASDLHRGGPVKDHLAQTLGRESDTHSKGRQLPGHAASESRNIYPVTSWVAGNLPGFASMGEAIDLRQQLLPDVQWRRSNAKDAITLATTGEGSISEGEALESIQEMLMRGGSAGILLVFDNEGAISTPKADTTINNDPLIMIRGLAEHGLIVEDIDATDIAGLFEAAQRIVNDVRENRSPAVIRLYNIYKRRHSLSDDPRKYKGEKYLKEMAKRDPIPLFKTYLIENGITTEDELNAIDKEARTYIDTQGQEVLAENYPDPKTLYEDVYGFGNYSPIEISDFPRDEWEKFVDSLNSSEEAGVVYLDEDEYWGRDNPESFELTYIQAFNLALAEIFKEDPLAVYFGQDIADFGMEEFNNLEELVAFKLGIMEEEYQQRMTRGDTIFRDPHLLSDKMKERLFNSTTQIKTGKGTLVSPDDFAMYGTVAEGKGGVFKTSLYLQSLFGARRVWNTGIREASQVGRGLAYSRLGLTPFVEIQFGPYKAVAQNQLEHILTTERWRSGGQFDNGMVIITHGGVRFNGKAGMGHGSASYGQTYHIVGYPSATAGTVDDVAGLLREGHRLARDKRQIVQINLPMSEFGIKGWYQGRRNIPWGKARIRHKGDDMLVLAHGNNVRVVEDAVTEWKKKGINPTVVDLRTVGVHTDWKTVAPLVRRIGKVLVVGAERNVMSSEGDISAKISEHLFEHLDARVVQLSGKFIRTSSTANLENSQTPQTSDVIRAGIHLHET